MPKVFKTLSQRNPKLASEWHPTKNASITPNGSTSKRTKEKRS